MSEHRSKKSLEAQKAVEAGEEQVMATAGTASTGTRLAQLQEEYLETLLNTKRDKLAQEKARSEQRVAAGKASAERANTDKRNCAHRRQDNTFCVNGQFNSDGRAAVICQRCMECWHDVPKAGTNEKPIPPAIREYLSLHGEHFGSAVGGGGRVQTSPSLAA